MTADALKLLLIITSISPPRCVFERHDLTRNPRVTPYNRVAAEARVKTGNHPPITENNSLFPVQKTEKNTEKP